MCVWNHLELAQSAVHMRQVCQVCGACECDLQCTAEAAGLALQLHTFKLDVYPGAILPFIIAYLADAATAVGDITATEEASMIETHGPRHDRRIQGMLLADGR